LVAFVKFCQLAGYGYQSDSSLTTSFAGTRVYMAKTSDGICLYTVCTITNCVPVNEEGKIKA
jgi:hypothetical protein